MQQRDNNLRFKKVVPDPIKLLFGNKLPLSWIHVAAVSWSFLFITKSWKSIEIRRRSLRLYSNIY